MPFSLTKEQLINELKETRQRVAQLEASKAEHKQAEKILSLPMEDYQKLFELLPTGVTILDMKGVILYCNSAVYNKGGYTEGEFTGKHFSKIASVRVKDIPTYIRVFNSIVRGKIPKSFEAIYQHKDGTTGWTELNINLVKMGRKRRILVIQHDITEHSQAEEALRAAEQNFRNSLDNSPLGIRIINIKAEGETIYANRAILDIYGYSSIEEFKSIPAVERHTPQSYAERQKRVRMREAGKPVPDRFEQSIINKNGEVRNLEVFNREVLWGGEKQFQLIYRDITGRKQAEEREKQLERQAQIQSRLATIGQMAAGIAHEINNPLVGVVGYAQLLQKKDLPDDIRKAVEIIYEGGQRVANIIRRMLTFAHQSKPEKTLVNIKEIIENLLEMRSYAMKSSRIKLSTHLASDFPTTVADAGQLEQAFLNIILNAETEMGLAHGKGELTVKSEVIDNRIRISFTDDGPGIAPENIEKVFDPFFTTRKVGQGTGLGLSVCHGIITEHNGGIYVESKLGKGATFVVELPIVGEIIKPKIVRETTDVAKKPATAKILVIDDEPMVTQIIEDLLAEEGHEVESVYNPYDAFQKLRSEEYDLIMLDIKLPDMSGIDMYQRIEEISSSLAKRVVFITGDVMGEDTMDFFSKTKIPYITKPFDNEELKKYVSQALVRDI